MLSALSDWNHFEDQVRLKFKTISNQPTAITTIVTVFLAILAIAVGAFVIKRIVMKAKKMSSPRKTHSRSSSKESRWQSGLKTIEETPLENI